MIAKLMKSVTKSSILIGTMYVNPNRATFLVSDTFAGLQAARLAFKHCIFVLMHVVFRH